MQSPLSVPRLDVRLEARAKELSVNGVAAHILHLVPARAAACGARHGVTTRRAGGIDECAKDSSGRQRMRAVAACKAHIFWAGGEACAGTRAWPSTTRVGGSPSGAAAGGGAGALLAPQPINEYR